MTPFPPLHGGPSQHGLSFRGAKIRLGSKPDPIRSPIPPQTPSECRSWSYSSCDDVTMIVCPGHHQLSVIWCISIEKQPCFRILDHPREPLIEISPRHGATLQDLPPVSPNVLQSQTLQNLVLVHAPLDVSLVCKHQETRARQSLATG